jgi:hypothetical protein
MRGVAPLSGLTKLDRMPESVTDADLKSLAALTRLRELDLSRTSITDAGLAYLKPLSNLRSLSLTRTRVTPRGVEELKTALPDVVVWGFPSATPSRPTPRLRGGRFETVDGVMLRRGAGAHARNPTDPRRGFATASSGQHRTGRR